MWCTVCIYVSVQILHVPCNQSVSPGPASFLRVTSHVLLCVIVASFSLDFGVCLFLLGFV